MAASSFGPTASLPEELLQLVVRFSIGGWRSLERFLLVFGFANIAKTCFAQRLQDNFDHAGGKGIYIYIDTLIHIYIYIPEND